MEKEFIHEPINSNSENNDIINNTDNSNGAAFQMDKKNLIKKVFIFMYTILLIILIINIIILIAKNESEQNCFLKKIKEDKKIYHCNYTNGDRYEGELLNGQRHGEGAYIWFNNSTYI